MEVVESVNLIEKMEKLDLRWGCASLTESDLEKEVLESAKNTLCDILDKADTVIQNLTHSILGNETCSFIANKETETTAKNLIGTLAKKSNWKFDSTDGLVVQKTLTNRIKAVSSLLVLEDGSIVSGSLDNTIKFIYVFFVLILILFYL